MTDLSATVVELDVSAVLRAGIYLLRRGSRVVYIGRTKCLLFALANIRARDRFSSLTGLALPAITFDSISVIPCAPDRAAALLPGLLALHNPIHNRPDPAPASPSIPNLRRPLPSASPCP